jgi:hypothetical protein
MFEVEPIYLICGVLLIAIIALEIRDRNHKDQENFEGGSWTEAEQSNINFGKPSKSGNAGTDGFYPPRMRCYDKQLEFDCSSYLYNWSDKNANTCSKQSHGDIANLPDNTAIPSNVLGRSAGRPRQCRKLY